MRTRLPNTNYRKFFILSVSYDANWDFPKTDKKISKLVGLKPKGFGLNVATKIREIAFEFEAEKKAEEVRKLLHKEGFQSSIHIYERDTL